MKNLLQSACWLLLLASLLSGSAGCSKQARLKKALADADAAYKAGLYAQAETNYLRIWRAAPDNLVAPERLALIYYNQGLTAKSYPFLAKALELQPENLELRSKLCMVLFAAGRTQAATDEAERLLAKQPGNEDALSVLADLATNKAQQMQRVQQLQQSDVDRPAYHVALGMLWLHRATGTNSQTELASAEEELKKALTLDPQSASAYSVLGKLYLKRMDLTNAASALQKAADLSPVRCQRRLDLAGFKFSSGAKQEARRVLEEITRKAPDYVPAWNDLAELAFEEHKYDECAACVQKVFARDSLDPKAGSLDAILKVLNGKSNEAIAQLERLLGFHGGSPELRYALALAYLVNGKPTQAEAQLNQISNFPKASVLLAEINQGRQDFASVVASMTSLIRQHPDLKQAHYLLASAYLAQRRPSDASAVYTGMLTLFPKDAEVPDALAKSLTEESRFLDTQGYAPEAQARRDKARLACQQALTLAPDFLSPLATLLELDMLEHRPAAALQRVQDQLARRPAVPELWLFLANIHLTQKNWPAAEEASRKAMELAPSLASAYQMLSRTYLFQSQPRKALEALSSFVARTNDPAVWLDIALLQDQQLGDVAGARAAYEKVLEANPRSADALNSLAYLYAERLGQLDKALPLAQKAHQLSPNPGIADTLGWILCRVPEPDYAKALALIQQAAAAFPQQPEVQFHLGIAHYCLGHEKEARSTLERALALSGTNSPPWAAEARTRLAILNLDPKTVDAAGRAMLEKRLADAPNDFVALTRLAAVYESTGSLDKALAAFERVLTQNPKNPAILSKLADLYAANNLTKALDLAKQAHTLAAHDDAISRQLAHLLLRIPDFTWANGLLQEVAPRLSDEPTFQFDLAWSCYGLGQLAQAEAALQKALDLGRPFEQSAEARRFLELMRAYQIPAQRLTVAANLPEVLAAKPDFVPALMVKGALAQDAGDFQTAKASFERALALYPSFTPAARDLALVEFHHSPTEPKLYELADQALRAFPEDPHLKKVLGVLTFRRAEYSKAAQLLRESDQKAPNDGETLCYLGTSLCRLNQPKEGKPILQKAISLNIAPDLMESAKKTLAELDRRTDGSL
jgi:tetratricopeptide (TPR) repeat protein